MNDRLTLLSCAKVNYTLDVLSLRPDGFHNIATILQTISLADTLHLSRDSVPGIRVTCDSPDVPQDESNLAFRAAAAVLDSAGRSEGIRIEISKRIPVQAGLGGGSSNAAYTLRGLNLLLELGISDERLLELAAGLGSDVPFFLVGGTAAARGRGESVTALPDGPPLWFVIVKPDVGVSTTRAYEALDSIPERASARATRQMEEILGTGDIERITARMTNDFEQAVFGEYLQVALAHDDLMMARARNSRLCGSGAAVFGVAYGRSEAEEIARLMRLKYESVHVCRAVTRAESMTIGDCRLE